LPDGVKKEVIKETKEAVEGISVDKPTTCDEVTVHYVARLEADGTVFDSSRDRGEPSTFVLGSGRMVKGLELSIATMKKGEQARFTIAPAFAYGDGSHLPQVPANATVIYEVELLRWTVRDDISGDKGIVKSTVERGSGWRVAKNGDDVCISFKTIAQGKCMEAYIRHRLYH